MFKKVLVANRGEIALRVLRACRELGIASVAVYSDADADGLPARYADEAVHIGAGPAAESYLNAGKLIAAAKATGAEAIHPGYGFLSERADFAQACADAGIVFIGPSPRSMAMVGNKVEARRIAANAGAPTVPGTPSSVSPEEAIAFAESIGYPVLIKAAGGGGGRGIRLVTEPGAMASSVQVAASEALAAFGDASLYVERYLNPVRHIEVQILADAHGTVLHLGERECSIQRRNQKLVEESPSPAVDPELRARLGAAAVAIAREADYVNAGTVEFLLDADSNFYFIEVNARLQVEHPVTELVTGIDLVKEQLRVAAGEPLGFRQEDVRLDGWAIECRITAEDASQGFRPNQGKIDAVIEPSGPGVRVDGAIFSGIEVPPFYDSLLSKLIVWGSNRDETVQRMRRALHEYVILGIPTTLPFHAQLFADPRFQAGDFDTRFLDEHYSLVSAESKANDDAALVAAALMLHAQAPAEQPGGSNRSGWLAAGRIRIDAACRRRSSLAKYLLKLNDREVAIDVVADAAGKHRARIDGVWREVSLEPIGDSSRYLLTIEGQRTEVVAAISDTGVSVLFSDGVSRKVEPIRPGRRQRKEGEGGDELRDGRWVMRSPLTGAVVEVTVAVGDTVEVGSVVLIIEAMKMQNELRARFAGAVTALHVEVGGRVELGMPLLEVTPPPDS